MYIATIHKCTEVQNPRYILSCYPAGHECMFGTNNTPAFHVIHTRYWTRIHTFGVHCLKASTEKLKQPNWNKTNKMNALKCRTLATYKDVTFNAYTSA